MSDHRNISRSTPMPREPLPARRRSWNRKGVIDGHTFHVSFGEYPDGRLGEIWIDAAKAGSTLRGVCGTVARMTSMSLQCGADVREVVGSLLNQNYPPNGPVVRGDGGSMETWEVSSLADWIGREIAEAYLGEPAADLGDSDTRPLPERAAGARDEEGENL